MSSSEGEQSGNKSCAKICNSQWKFATFASSWYVLSGESTASKDAQHQVCFSTAKLERFALQRKSISTWCTEAGRCVFFVVKLYHSLMLFHRRKVIILDFCQTDDGEPLGNL